MLKQDGETKGVSFRVPEEVDCEGKFQSEGAVDKKVEERNVCMIEASGESLDSVRGQLVVRDLSDLTVGGSALENEDTEMESCFRRESGWARSPRPIGEMTFMMQLAPELQQMLATLVARAVPEERPTGKILDMVTRVLQQHDDGMRGCVAHQVHLESVVKKHDEWGAPLARMEQAVLTLQQAVQSLGLENEKEGQIQTRTRVVVNEICESLEQLKSQVENVSRKVKGVETELGNQARTAMESGEAQSEREKYLLTLIKGLQTRLDGLEAAQSVRVAAQGVNREMEEGLQKLQNQMQQLQIAEATRFQSEVLSATQVEQICARQMAVKLTELEGKMVQNRGVSVAQIEEVCRHLMDARWKEFEKNLVTKRECKEELKSYVRSEDWSASQNELRKTMSTVMQEVDRLAGQGGESEDEEDAEREGVRLNVSSPDASRSPSVSSLLGGGGRKVSSQAERADTDDQVLAFRHRSGAEREGIRQVRGWRVAACDRWQVSAMGQRCDCRGGNEACGGCEFHARTRVHFWGNSGC